MTTARNVPARGNVTNGVDRILNMPRCRVWRSTGIAGAATGGFTYDTFDYDTDGMATIGAQVITCRTAGTYAVQGHVEYTSGTGARWTRIIINSTPTLYVAGCQSANSVVSTAGVATHHDVYGHWRANAGDTCQLYVACSGDTSNITGGQYNCFLSACLISL